MTEDEYVAEILRKYAVNTQSAKDAASRVAPDLRAWAGAQLAEIKYSGSFAKGTANSTSADIDLFISLRSNTDGTLKEIYERLFNLAAGQGWQPRRQNVSVRAKVGGVDIDLVPGRTQSGTRNYHSLYKRRGDTWTQTNIDLHIRTVSDSHRTREIRAIKVWRDLHKLDFPSIHLELFVIDALKNRSYTALARNFIHALEALADSLATTRIADPANTNNVISDDLSRSEKEAIANRARISAGKKWEEILW